MKKITMVFGILFSCAVGIAIASTVSTVDGINFNVTNDANISTNWTNSQIVQKENFYNQQMNMDNRQISIAQQKYQTDSEGYMLMNGVEQMAQNAEASWKANQVNAS